MRLHSLTPRNMLIRHISVDQGNPVLVIQWRFKIWPFKIQKHLKSGLFEGQISNVPVFKGSGLGYSHSPNHLKTWPFKIWMFLSGFQMIFHKLVAICLDFKCLGFQISEPIRNPDHFELNNFSTEWNPK